MKINLIVVGKTVNKDLINLIDGYHKRLSHYVPFQIDVIAELKNAAKLTEEQIKDAEGKLILQLINDANTVILLDEHGREYRSIEFAQYVQQLMSAGRNVTFVIGGAYGFSKAVYERANAKLSLSKMTFSHQMIRLIFVEQLYRAQTILRGEPYHHE